MGLSRSLWNYIGKMGRAWRFRHMDRDDNRLDLPGDNVLYEIQEPKMAEDKAYIESALKAAFAIPRGGDIFPKGHRLFCL